MPEIKICPYEVLLRWNCQRGEIFGGLRATSLATQQVLVNEDGTIAGRLDRGREDHPTDFPAEQLEQLLGEQFVAFQAAQSAERAGAAAALAAEQDGHAQTQHALGERIATLQDEVAQLTAERDRALALAEGHQTKLNDVVAVLNR